MFRWSDVPPNVIDFHRRLVSIEYSVDGKTWLPLEERGIGVDDDGYDLSVVFMDEIKEQVTGPKTFWNNVLASWDKFKDKFSDGRMWVYETRWYNPERKEGRSYRFRIEQRQGQEVFFSKAFK